MPSAVPPSGMSGDTTPALLTETRQQNTDIKMSVGRMSDKIDQMLEKVTKLTQLTLKNLLACFMWWIVASLTSELGTTFIASL